MVLGESPADGPPLENLPPKPNSNPDPNSDPNNRGEIFPRQGRNSPDTVNYGV